MSEPPPRARPGCLRRALRGLAALAIGLAVALLGIELALRWAVLSDSAAARRIGEKLRVPSNFANEDVEEVFWKLQHRFTPPESLGEVPGYDEHVGWVGDLVVPDTYEHLDAPSVGERTPVLFYGDSFAQCVVPKPQCFQGLMERSDLDPQYRLLNYGVGGFGFDQAYLMLARTIDHWKGRQPIVVLAILVESDLDRCVLDFRGWPKPRLEPDGRGGVRLREETVPSVDEYFERHSLQAGSLLWRALLYRNLAPIRGWQTRQQIARARIDEKKELARAILASAHRLLEERGVRHFVLLFNVRGPFDDPRYTWQEPFLHETCAELGMPLVSVRPWFDLVVDANWNHADLYYIGPGPGEGHYNAAGNEIAFEALRAGIEGRFGDADTTRLRGKIARKELPSPNDRLRQTVMLGRNTWITARASRSCVRAGTSARLGKLYDPGDDSEAVCIRGGEEGPTRVAFDHDETPARFRADLLLAKRPGVECVPGRLTVEIRARGEMRFSGEIDARTTPVDIDLTGAKALEIVVANEGGDSECGWVVLSHPRFEAR
jgi:hypothetical protein